MSNKEFNKKFEEILKDLFNDKNSFFDNFSEKTGDWKKFINKSKDGFLTSIMYVFEPNEESNDLVEGSRKIKSLQRELDRCIKEQNFERAAVLRDEIKELSDNKSKISELQKEMEVCIKEQNFERAIEIRDELKKIN